MARRLKLRFGNQAELTANRLGDLFRIRAFAEANAIFVRFFNERREFFRVFMTAPRDVNQEQTGFFVAQETGETFERIAVAGFRPNEANV